MLQTAGTTVRSRRKPFNTLWSISAFSSPPLRAAWSDMHTVTDSFSCYWVYPFSHPTRSHPVALLQLQFTHSAGTLVPLRLTLRFLHGCAPGLRSVVVLHCLSGGCQRLGFRVMLAALLPFRVAPASPLLFLYCRLLWVS